MNIIAKHPGRRRSRGFSLIEMMIALTISSLLLVASLSALDALFKSYQATSESASTHVVSRMVMHRILAMVRNGTEFAPYPEDVLDSGQNPLVEQEAIEFVTFENPATGVVEISRLERRASADYTTGGTSYELRGPFTLWLEVHTLQNGVETGVQERPLLDGLEALTFTLEYDVGPRLRRATIDMMVRTDMDQIYEADGTSNTSIGMMDSAPPIRLVASVSPRNLD